MDQGLTPLLGYAIFVVISVITPGPNNIMTLHSGARYGIRRTVPLVLGIQFGFAVMMAIIAFSSSIVLNQVEEAGRVLQAVCFVYLLYLAWRIGTSPAPDLENTNKEDGRPIKAFEAALFQWVNPKAWAVAIAAVGTYSFLFSGTAENVVGFTASFLLVGLPSTFLWASGGRLVAGILTSPTRYRIFSVAAAVLMIAAVVPALLSS